MLASKALKKLKSKDYGRTRESRVTELARLVTAINAESILVAHCTEMAGIIEKMNNHELTNLENSIKESLESEVQGEA